MEQILLAPNGKLSNLTPEQYRLVRGQEFKRWFGDWENDPENASRVIDSNGEPKVMYHGARAKFSVFENNNENKLDWTIGGNGFYFTSLYYDAYAYGQNVLACFIKSNYVLSDGHEHAFVNDYLLHKIKSYGADGIYFDGERLNTQGKWVKVPDELVVFESNQIKLADGTNTTFDSNNPDIRFDRGGRTIAQTPAPKSDRIYGSKVNKQNSAKDIKSAKRIVFDQSTNQKIANKVATHNKKHQGKEIPIEVAKAVVRRGMGAYSKSHRPTISKGNPNSRVAWGLARLDAFIYKIVHGTSKSGRYSQDNDLIEELGINVKKYDEGGLVPRRNQIGDVIFEDAWLITRDEYNKQNLKTHLPKGTRPDKATLKLQDYFAQITNRQHSSKVNDAIQEGLYAKSVNNGQMTRERANEIISSIGNTTDLIPITETTSEVKSEKQQMKDIIELLRESLEYMDDSKEILTTQDLIETLEESLEFMDGDDDSDNMSDDMNEEEQIEVVEQKSDYTPAYLMTLDEYKESGIIALITEYSKFLTKNKEWLKGSYYGSRGLDFYTIEEHIELSDKSPLYWRMKDYDDRKSNEKLIIEKFYNYSRRGDDIKNPKIIPTPLNILEQNKEYQKKLAKFFNKKDLSEVETSKDKKSNKRIVKSAVDNDTYYNLVKNNELTIDRLRDIANSVDVRITKRIFSADKREAFREEMKKELSKVPKKNYDDLMDFADIIYKDLKPIGDNVYQQEFNRYLEFINKSVGKTYPSPSLSRALAIWRDVFTYTKTPVYKKNRYGRDEYEYDNITIKSIIDGNSWKPTLAELIKEYVLSLKFSIVKAMITQFQYIKLPLKSLERIFIRLGIKGFEGEYKFIFEDGSNFVLETRGIGAGGYNIQVYHYRYIINMKDYKLSDGTKTDWTYFR